MIRGVVTEDDDATEVALVAFELPVLELPVDVLAVVETLVGDLVLDEDVTDFNVVGLAGTVMNKEDNLAPNSMILQLFFLILSVWIDPYLLEVYPQLP